VGDHPAAELTLRLQDAVAGADLEMLDALLDDRFVLVTGREGAEQRDRREYLDITANRYQLDSYRIERLEVDDHGVVAVVRSRLWQRATMDGRSRTGVFVMTDTWVRGGDGWRLVSRHASPLVSP
jgi:hypothetical protein